MGDFPMRGRIVFLPKVTNDEIMQIKIISLQTITLAWDYCVFWILGMPYQADIIGEKSVKKLILLRISTSQESNKVFFPKNWHK